ncbi:MAG: hypothetical protein ACRD0U_12755 [Acidimicrobiales bacterium]
MSIYLPSDGHPVHRQSGRWSRAFRQHAITAPMVPSPVLIARSPALAAVATVLLTTVVATVR